MMNRFLVVLFLVFASVSFGQTSEKYNSDYENFYRAEELYNKMQYGAARKEFRNFIESFQEKNDPMYVKAMYYEGVSALELFNNDAVELLEAFIRNYPESIYRNDIYFRLGKYYYQKKQYDDAIDWFDKLTESEVEPEDRDEFYFKKGYSHFKEDNLEEARSAFHEVKDGVSEYANPALYYYSHIAYLKGDYQTALEGFLKLEEDENFGKVVPLYIIQIYYLQGKYNEVTAYAPKVKESNLVNEKDLNYIIGDGYYKTGRYDEAVPYLEEYNRSSKTTRDEDYQLGYAYYKSNQCENAIKLFDRATREEDELAQTAFYHIGECYMKAENFISARAAFKKASEISANPTIEEDALYQYAILSYQLDINPYNEAIDAFETYLEKYPNSERKNDVYQYLVNVYTSTSNYERALASLERIPDKDIKLKKAYQLIAYNHGVELYQRANYPKSISTLQLVNKYPIDASLTGKAKFWEADGQFMMKNYTAAVAGYRSFLTIPAVLDNELKNDAYYNIGYAYLKMGDTTLAIETFRTYTQNDVASKMKFVDAHMRLGDAYFMRKANDESISYYEKVISLNIAFQDQALYYAAMLYGVKGQTSKKISYLLNIVNNYSNSKYVQPALFEVGHTYKLREEFSSALRYFDQLITDYPNSDEVKDAHVDIADIYFKQGKYSQSEQEYLLILQKYGNENYYCEAVGVGLSNVYSKTGQHQKLQQLAEQYPCLNISNYALEKVLWDPAKESYEAKQYAQAIQKINAYLQKYPTGYYALEAMILLGNSYYKLEDMVNAIASYERYLQKPNHTWTEFAASRVAKYYYNNEMYNDAIPHYERVEEVSGDAEVTFNAQLGLMRCNFLTEDYEAAAAYGKMVLDNELMITQYRLESEYAFGISSYRLKRYTAAVEALDYVTKNTTTEIAAESKYSIADIHYQTNDLTTSETTIKALLKMKPSYDYWIAKGLILQTRIHMQRDELFEAEQTINSVIDHYPIQDDGIIAEATALRDEIMQLKSQPKNNIVPDGTTIIDINNNGGN